MRNNKTALIKSAIALILSIALLIGSTFAWFTDYVTSSGNIIHAGNLDIEMYWTDDLSSGTWYNVEDAEYNTIFNYDNWEPGYTDVKYIKLVNKGNLAFNYKLAITPSGEVGKLAEVINVYYANDGVEVASREELDRLGCLGLLTNVMDGRATATGTLLTSQQYSPLHDSGETIITLAMNMITTAGNEYQGKSIGDGFTITALATQCPFEEDSFGSSYDSASKYPAIIKPGKVSETVNPVNGKVPAGGVKIEGDGYTANVPEGVVLKKNASQLDFSVTPLNNTSTDITVVNDEILVPVDIHIDGVAENNTIPIIIDLGEVLPKHLNMGNYRLYHVENGQNQVMTLVDDREDLTAHNTFTYDPVTGFVSVAMATFSEVALVADTAAGWKGEMEEFASGSGTEADPYIIANADQLAYTGDRISNANAEYADKHYQLIADVNLGNGENAVYFYPIGFNKVGGEVATISDNLEEIYFEPISYGAPGDKDSDVLSVMGENSWYTYGGAFKGVFDGMGHTVSNIYQNTWAMKGDYDGHYYNEAMGLFGYVYGGTVKNVTVKNFNSEGEFAPTGCITAYAGGNTTFENITILNSHPQTYNTGVAGIVGWDNGNSTFNFKNITVDATNTISALWGSWDVAASGILGSLKNESSANFDNCHVAATIDVYNDVCGNYQYYWYRYSGAFIGTVYARLNGGTGALDLENVKATNCTANFGDRHEYYYCEFVKNSIASYTHDYQMSRVNKKTDIGLNEIGEVVCKGHNHEESGYQTIDGVEILVEDKQAVYIPYKQLFGGYGWGVAGIDLDEYNTLRPEAPIGISVVEEAEEKFAPADGLVQLETDSIYSIGELFKINPEKEADNVIAGGNVQVTVSPVEGSDVKGVYTTGKNGKWEEGTLKLTGTGRAQIIITDYYFCQPTSVFVTVTTRSNKDKFDTLFVNNEAYTYRVGNANAVSLSSIFKASEGAKIDGANVQVNIKNSSGTAVGTYTANTSDWTKGTIQFIGTGKVDVSITDNDYCNNLGLTLEVVDAVNTTSAINATSNNVVLLNNCGFSSLEVSGGYTLYGNGFTMTCGSDSPALDTGYSFVTLNNGILDNVQIICPNFDYAVLYKSNMTESGNRSQTTDRTRYYNVKSGVMVSGNSQILNSRISGARAAVNVTGGNLLIDNSRIELGAVASILVGSANRLTLRDVTLVQKPTASTYDSSKALMGFSVLFICDADGNTAPVTIEGTLVQNAWVDEADKDYVPSAGQSIISTVLGKTDYLHDIDGNGKNESLNLGFAYMPESLTSKVNTTTITDSRIDKNSVPYDYAEVSILNGKTYVYSYKNTNGTDNTFKKETDYVPNKQGDIITVTYADASDGLEDGKTFGTDGWVYELNVDLDKKSGYKLDFSKLSMSVNGTTVTDFKVNGSAKPTSPVAVIAGGVTYTLTATVNGKEYTALYKVTGTETSKESPSKISGPTTAGFGVAKSYGGDWSGAADVLTGVKIKYWSVAENKYVEFDFSEFTVPGSAGKLNGTNSYWEYTHTNNDFSLKVTNTVAIHSGKSVYGMPIRGTDGKLYFTISSTNGYVGSGTTSRAITMQYEFTDNNGGEKLTFTHTFNISYSKDDQYSYSDLSGSGKLTKLEGSSGGSSSGCVTPDTLITLADGTQKRVDSLTGEEMLLVWNIKTGKYEAAPIVFVDSDEEAEWKVVRLNFSDGSVVNVIAEHGFFDLDLGKYVYIDADNYADYVGHKFVKVGDVSNNTWEIITLDSVVVDTEVTTAWSPVTFEHLCYYTNGVLSMPGGIEGLFNIFEVDTDTMRYDEEQMQKDIDTYGLFTLEDFGGLISEAAFEAFNGDYLKVAIAKGILTWEDIARMAERYIPLM